MSLQAAAWCVTCGATPEVVVTVERNGVLAHYGACVAHIELVATRVRTDLAAIDRVSRPETAARPASGWTSRTW